MKTSIPLATVFIAVCAISTGATAQKVYRCGASYSQMPCPDAITLEADDARSKAQKTDSDKIIARDVSSANAIEKARLKEEKLALKQAKASALTGQASKSKGEDKAELKDKKKASKKKATEFFTAAPPSSK